MNKKTNLIEQNSDGISIINTSLKNGEVESNSEQVYIKNELKNFISDGADFILQRIIITKGCLSVLHVSGLDSKNNLCEIDYVKSIRKLKYL